MKSQKINKESLKNKSQFLDSIFNVIPNKTFINKFLTNTGATTLEIESNRHSIIIEPNVPVIVGKEEYYNKSGVEVRGVYEDVTYFDILDYLDSDIPFKKIITTPESYPKVRSAINASKFKLYTDFFILLDECERVIQDCGYRNKITLPFEDFFQFKGRAMISATPLMPSDPRFKDFKHIQVVPKFQYKKDLTLTTTNSILLSLSKYLEQHQDDHYFIFINSPDVAAALIKQLDIKTESNIYCARESVIKLNINGFSNSAERITQGLPSSLPFKKYNFLTSRFFSAVDIKLDFKPTVIMMTDTQHAFHSILDPLTESVQIIGRFRNGYKQAVHISLTTSPFKPKSEDASRAYLEGCEKTYQDLLALYNAATNEGSKSTLKEALERVEYAHYINDDGSKNDFMWDNFVNEERVKAYYNSKESLVNAYSSCKQLRMIYTSDKFPEIELVLNRLRKTLSPKLTYQRVSELINDLIQPDNEYPLEDIQFAYKHISRAFPEVVEAFSALGFKKLQELDFNKFNINKAIYGQKSEVEKGNFELLNYLKLEFEVGAPYSGPLITNVLRTIINQLGLSLKPEIKLLKQFFDLGPRTTIARTSDGSVGKVHDIKGYFILKRNFD